MRTVPLVDAKTTRNHMSSQFGRNGRVVPLRVARQLMEQRDRAVEKLQNTRRERDRLASAMRNAERECEELEQRLEQAHERIESLRETARTQKTQSPSESEEVGADDQVVGLQTRIDRLTDDLDRMRRRTADEVADARRDERVRLLAGLGEVLDAVDRAVEFGDDDTAWMQGLEAIRRQLLAFFRGEGAEVVGVVGDPVDPRMHQAIDQVEAPEVERGHIARVDRVGIVLEDGTVVRPAQVAVAR